MTETKNHHSEGNSLHGQVFSPRTPAEVSEAVEQAFDYRGDVTFRLRTGEIVTGYVFNRHARGDTPYLELFPLEQATPRRIVYQEIQELALTGEDTASGKSWEAWVGKKESQRLKETARVEAEARARGHL